MKITITDIEYLPVFEENHMGGKIIVRKETSAKYVIEFNDGCKIDCNFKSYDYKSKQEIIKYLIKKYNIMETKFISLEKKEVWKTIFTHILNSEDGWVEASFTPEYYDKVVYLGNCVFDGDMFACYKENAIEICKGVAGNEFK